MQRSAYRCYKLFLQAVLLGAVYSVLTSTVMAQEPVGKAGEPQKLTAPAKEELSSAPAKVDVNPVARDEEILKRLQSVLDATDWFTDPQVRVEEGVVFLNGQVESEELKKWAGDLARNTQDVVAVANRMEVLEPSVWDFRPASSGLLILWRDFIRSLPFIMFGLLILALSVGAGMLATGGARAFLRRRIRTKLLRNVIARGAGGLVFLCGAYIILRVSGLTQLALTVVGGTGLIGLARWHRIPGNHRELPGQHLPQHAAAVRDRRPGRGVRRDRVRAAVEHAHDDLDDPRWQPRADPKRQRLQEQPPQLHDQLQPAGGLCRRHRLRRCDQRGPGDCTESAGGPPGRSERPRALGAGGQLGEVYSQPARLLLAQRPRTQLVEGAVFGDPAGETRLSGTWHLDARRGPRGCLPSRRPRHRARRETGRCARCHAGKAAPC